MNQKSNLKSVKFTLLFLSIGQVFDIILGFLKSLLVVRICGANLYGQYQYIAQLAGAVGPFHQFLYRIPERFFVTEKQNRAYLLWANILTHSTILFCFSFGIYFLIDFGLLEIPANFQSLKWVFILLLVIPFNNIFKTLNSYILRSFERYHILTQTSVALGFLNLFTTAFIYFIPNKDSFLKLELILLSVVFLEVMSTIFFSFYIYKHKVYSFPKIPTLNPIELFKKGVWAHKSYVLPLVGQYFSGYLRNSLPALLLGNVSQFETVTYYQVAKKIFSICHRIIPTSIRIMLPTVVLKKYDPEFSKRWKKYCLCYMMITLSGACLFYFSKNLVLYFYNLPPKIYVSDVFFFFSISLVSGAWAHANEPLILAKKDTSILFPISLVRQMLWVLLIFLLRDQLNASTFSMVNFVSSLIPAFSLAYWVAKKVPDQLNPQFIYLGFVLVSVAILLPFK